MTPRKLKLSELSVKSFVTMNAHHLGAIKGGTNNNNNGDQSYKCQVTLGDGPCQQKTIEIGCDTNQTADCTQAACDSYLCETNDCFTIVDCTGNGMC